MARPPKRVRDRQTVVVALRLTRADKERLDAAAAREGLPVATYARVRALAATKEK